MLPPIYAIKFPCSFVRSLDILPKSVTDVSFTVRCVLKTLKSSLNKKYLLYRKQHQNEHKGYVLNPEKNISFTKTLINIDMIYMEKEISYTQKKYHMAVYMIA